jgi:hypothetical protein
MGRPTKLTRKVRDRILASIRLGRTFQYSAQKAGVSYSAFLLRRNGGPKFAEEVDAAMCEWEDVHLANIDAAAKTSWPASAWRLQRAFPEKYADPNVLIQLNAASSQQPSTAIWFQPGALAAGQDDLEITSELDAQPPQLLAPAPSVPQRPEPPDFESLPQAVRAHEATKYYSSLPSQPVQEVPAEVVQEPGMQELSAKVNRHVQDVGSVGDRLRDSYAQSQFAPGQRITAARPSPSPRDGHSGWDGSIEPING